MNKQEFLTKLRNGLSGLPQQDVEERLAFYSEMIDDRMEEGFLEDEAVFEIGSIEEIVSQIVSDTPLAKIAKERIKATRKLRVWEIVLLVLGSPIWLSLAVAVFSVILSIYVSLWAVIISLWAVFISALCCAISGVVAGIILACNGYGLSGIALTGAGIVCSGLSIFIFYGCKAVTKGIVLLTRNIALGIKNCFLKKEEA